MAAKQPSTAKAKKPEINKAEPAPEKDATTSAPSADDKDSPENQEQTTSNSKNDDLTNQEMRKIAEAETEAEARKIAEAEAEAENLPLGSTLAGQILDNVFAKAEVARMRMTIATALAMNPSFEQWVLGNPLINTNRPIHDSDTIGACLAEAADRIARDFVERATELDEEKCKEELAKNEAETE